MLDTITCSEQDQETTTVAAPEPVPIDPEDIEIVDGNHFCSCTDKPFISDE